MSTIAGLVSLNESAERVAASFNLVFDALAHRVGSPERWQNSHCALGARVPPGLCDGLEKSHATHPPTGCAIVFDGRLDNRDELLAQLPDLQQAQPASGNGAGSRFAICDAEIVLHAYLHWAEDCAAKLLGDFAFAVWDPRTRSLYAARDPMGVRPFFYTHLPAQIPGRFAFASEFKSLLSLPGVTRTPDDFMVSEYLLWWSDFPDISRTFFQNVSRLLPANWLRWNARGVESHRYWAINPNRRIHYREHREYVENFESLLTRAVSVRMRGCRRVGILLSGGKDSSSVASVAARFTNSHRNVLAYTTKIEDPADESHLAELVARNSGIPLRRHVAKIKNVLPFTESYVVGQCMPFVALGSFNDADMLQLATQDGCQVVLTGDASDELFNFPWGYVADLLRAFQIGKLIHELGPYSRYQGRSPAEALKLSCELLVPRTVRHAWKFFKWRNPPRWVAPDFARRTELVQRLRRIRPVLPFDSLSAEIGHHAMIRGRRVLSDEHRELQAASFGASFRYPFYDCRLMEFMWAVPWQEKVTDGRVKSFLREAPGLIPPEIANLQEKANYTSYALAEQRVQQWQIFEPLFSSPPRIAAEFVDLHAARRAYTAFVYHNKSEHMATTFGLATFFLWLKNCQ